VGKDAQEENILSNRDFFLTTCSLWVTGVGLWMTQGVIYRGIAEISAE